MATERALLVVGPAEGKVWNVGGPIICKVSSEEVGGAYTILELVLPPQGGPPLHVHYREDEIFYVVAGECTVGSKEGAQAAPAGTTVIFPKGTPHFFRNDSSMPCKVMITAVPGGLDHYFEEVSEAIAGGRPETIPAINQKYEIDFNVKRET